MNRKEQHINQLLRRWLKGDVNRSEEAELEATAREDEFLASAMEGYRQHAADDHSAHLAKLRGQLAEEPAGRRVGIPLWRVAAAIAILVVAVGVLWIGTADAPLSDLAMDNKAAPPMEQPSQDMEGVTSTTAEDLTETEEETLELPVEPPSPPATSISPKRETRPDNTPGTGGAIAAADGPLEGEPQLAAKESLQLREENDQDAIVLDGVPITTEAAEYAVEDQDPIVLEAAEPQVDLPVENSPVAPPAPMQAPPATYNSRDRVVFSNAGVPTAQEGFRLVQGTVKDAEGYPLIGATILQPGTTNGTITDIDGSFLLSVDESSQALQVSYTGYETTFVNIDDELTIALEEDGATLDEVVVTGYGQARRQNTADEESTLRPFARPEMGLSAYKDYLDEQTALVTGRGKVRLEFKVYSDGSIREVEVIRSTNPGLNAKAIDLLQNGPKWEIVTGDAPVETVYVIRFR